MWPFKKKDTEPFPLEERIFLAENLPDVVSDIPGCCGMNRQDRTPDRLWLERHDWRLLFVYCEMMHSRRMYHMLQEDSINLCKAFTETDDWVMYKKKLGEETFPIAFKSDLGKPLRIKGEIHAVRPHLFWNLLDKRFLNGTEFRRERVKLWVPYHIKHQGVTIDHNEFIQRISAFMYVGVPEYWNTQIDGGYSFAPVSAFKSNKEWVDGKRISSYYHYSRLEDETNF